MNDALAGTAYLDIAGRTVEAARRAGASDAEAWINAGHSAAVKVRDGEIDERIDFETGTLTLRVFIGSRTATVSSSDLDPDVCSRLAAEAVALAALVDPDPCAGLPDEPNLAPLDTATLDLVDPVLADPAPDLLHDLARRADAAARGHDPRVRSGEGALATRWAGTTALVNSRGFAESYFGTMCSLLVSAAADDDGGKKCEGWWYAGDRHLAAMEDPETVGRIAAERTLRQLGAGPVATQVVPVVWAPEAAREFLAMLARAVSGEERYRGSSFLIEREGETIGSPLVTIVDDAMLPGRLGSRPFDAEGVVSRRTPLLSNGVFTGFVYDTYSARKAGRTSTANAGRSEFTAQVGVAASNLVMMPGSDAPEAIIGGVRNGLYLTDMLGFGENLTTGDFSRGAAGVWIENGELAQPVAEINIAGRLQAMLASIDAVGNDDTFVESISAPTFRMAELMVSGR